MNKTDKMLQLCEGEMSEAKINVIDMDKDQKNRTKKALQSVGLKANKIMEIQAGNGGRWNVTSNQGSSFKITKALAAKMGASPKFYSLSFDKQGYPIVVFSGNILDFK